MFEGRFYTESNGFNEVAPFKQKRTYGYHCGKDVNHLDFKKTKMRSEISGVIANIKLGDFKGNSVHIRHNSKFSGGIDESFYFAVCHLSVISNKLKINKFVEANTVLGNMGNTGYCLSSLDSRYVKRNSKFSRVTLDEMTDVFFNGGVHGHVMYYQKNVAIGEETKLLAELVKLGFIDKRKYFYQWNNLYFDPEVIYKYFEFLKEDREYVGNNYAVRRWWNFGRLGFKNSF